MTQSPLRVERTGSLVRLILARASVRNAFNAELIGALTAQAQLLAHDVTARTVILEGEGTHFCAGADLQWMRDSADLSEADNIADAERMGHMFTALDALPQFVIGRIHGAALGGGTGLTAICDTALASDDCVFAFTEVRLGLIPAVISPFIVRKTGLSHARSYFVRGERFDAATALRIGLIHGVVPLTQLDQAVTQLVEANDACAPGAVAATKKLLRELEPAFAGGILADDQMRLRHTAAAIAARRVSDEGQRGLRAFLDRTSPPWKTR